VFFPEGTFEPAPGLLRFHSGAFVTAVRNGYPVVPMVIRGTRRILPPHFFWPQPGIIELEFLEPVASSLDGIEADAAALRDRARSAILAQLGEPDRAG